MSETPTSSEPATGPVAAPPAAPPPAVPVVRDETRRSKVTVLAAWVGIVAGVVFIVAVIFFSGFVLGAHTGGHRGPGGYKGDHGVMEFRHGPPPGFQMPRGEFGPPPGPGFGPGFGPGGPNGPRFAPPQPPSGPQSPGPTTTPPRP